MQQQDSLLSADPTSGKRVWIDYGLISLLFLLFFGSSHSSHSFSCFPWFLCLNSVPLSLQHCCHQEVLVLLVVDRCTFSIRWCCWGFGGVGGGGGKVKQLLLPTHL